MPKQSKTTEIKAESAICVQGKSISNHEVSCHSILIFHFVSKIGKIGSFSLEFTFYKENHGELDFRMEFGGAFSAIYAILSVLNPFFDGGLLKQENLAFA